MNTSLSTGELPGGIASNTSMFKSVSTSSFNIRNRLGISRSLDVSFNATKPSAPKIGFGTSSRPALLQTTIEAPGPGAYTIKSTLVGKTDDSTIRSTPQFSLRGREKFGDPMNKASDVIAMNEPGPGHYVPRAYNSTISNPPKFSFPKSSMLPDKMKMVPGPGAYRLPPAVGKQALSTKKTYKATEFGRGDRPALLVQSTADVGPGEYGSGESACGQQLDSRRRTTATTKFGKDARDSTRKKKLDIDGPGPGSYSIPTTIGAYAKNNPYKSGPSASLSGRQKFGSPFGW